MVVRKLAAGALLLLLVIWGGASGSGPARADGEVRGCDPKVGTGSADWCDDADRLPDIATIDKLARSVGGDRFGGIYIDRDVTPSVYVVSLVNPTEEDRAEFRKLSPDLSEIRVRGVQFPLSKLTQTADDIGAEDESQKILYSGGPSVIENKVVVRVDGSLKGKIAAIVDKLGLDERMIEYGSPEKFAAGASRTTFPPFAGV